MTPSEKAETQARILTHYKSYPALLLSDLFKFLHQSAFGCEHLVTDEADAIKRIRKEFNALDPVVSLRVDPLDGNYSRIPLSLLECGLSPETLGKLLCSSAKSEPNGLEALEAKLSVLRTMIESGTLPFSLNEFDTQLTAWREKGYPALHHSEHFRARYHPAYRVIANEYVSLISLFTEIDRLVRRRDPSIIAIEGGSASGKTTLAALLSSLYDCNVFHMDDFFLRPEQRTRERLEKIGGNIDHERFLEEILLPLRTGGEASYRSFDCSTQSLGDAITVPEKRLNIIEGAYSMHPALSRFYHLSVFLEVSHEKQRERILHRNPPALAERFFTEWIPLEVRYFEETKAKKRCDLAFTFGD